MITVIVNCDNEYDDDENNINCDDDDDVIVMMDVMMTWRHTLVKNGWL